MESIKITLETLYDILRNEKKREDLQSLEDSFFIDVVSYLREKKSLLENKKDSNNHFSVGEKDKLEYELKSIKRILKEIYEKREKKIIDIALNRSRTGSDIIDTSSMLREEKDFYQDLLKKLDLYRKGILFNLFDSQLPNIEREGKSRVDITIKKEPILEKKEETGEKEPVEEEAEVEMTKIRFTHPTPSFIWKDMKVYGPFAKDEETEIFPEVADLLVRKGRAEKV